MRFTPPKTITFLISAVLAILALLVTYGGIRVPVISGNAFPALAIAWILLAAGVLVRGL